MSNNNMERMKKLIEEKKNLNAQKGTIKERGIKKIGNNHKAIINRNGGGVFDK